MVLFTILIIFLLTPVVLTIASIGAVACGVIAVVRKLNVVQSIVAGALFGFFVFPLFLLIPRLLGRFLPIPVLWLVYGLACLLWLGFAVEVVATMYSLWDHRIGGSQFYDVVPITAVVVGIILLTPVIPVSGLTILWSLRTVYRLDREDKGLTEPNPIPSFRYLLPSVLSSVWFFVAGPILGFLFAAYLSSQGYELQGF